MRKNLLVVAVSSAALLFAANAFADGGPVPEPAPPTPAPEPAPEPEPEPEPAPAYEPAPEPEYNWYTTIFAGVAFGDHEGTLNFDFGEGEAFSTSSEVPMEMGYLLGWTLGYDNLFGGDVLQFRPEVELSFRQQDVDLEEAAFDFFGIDLPEEDTEPFALSADLLTLMANLWIDFDLGGGFTPYVGGGIGIGWADIFIAESTDFAWQFGGGVNVELSPRTFLGVGYRYLGADFEEDIDLLGLASAEYEYRSHEVLANFGVRF
ncbi:MAG: outer membrane protein [Alphaproteobacteria bacterium]